MTEPIEIEIEIAKSKVMAAHEEAWCHPWGEKGTKTAFTICISRTSHRQIGNGRTEEAAWIDAASRLPARVEPVNIPEVCGSAKAPAGWSCTRDYGHDGPCAAMQIPIQVYNNDPPVCQRCESEYNLCEGYEVSKYCDTCAQELVTEYELRMVAPIPSATGGLKFDLQNPTQMIAAALLCRERQLLEILKEFKSLPGKWSEDSSLATWFPITAEHIAGLEDKLLAARKENAHLKPNIAEWQNSNLANWWDHHPRPANFDMNEYALSLEGRVRWLEVGVSCSREDRKGFKERAEQAAAALAAMTEDRNLWQQAHDEDCPNKAAIDQRDVDIAQLKKLLTEIVDEIDESGDLSHGTMYAAKAELARLKEVPNA